MKRSSLPSYSIGHFLVGFTGAFLLSRMSLLGYTEEGYELPSFLLILCALSTVFIAGIVTDLMHSNGRLPAVLGLMLSASSLIVGGSSPETSAVLAGIGYSLFAVGGFTDVLSSGNGHLRTALFVFSVFPGMAAGRIFGSAERMRIQIPVFITVFIACCIITFCNGRRGDNEGDDLPAGKDAFITSPWLSVAIVTLSAFALSWAYCGLKAPESESRFAAIIPSAALAAGIFFGGFFDDLFGARFVNIASGLLCAAALFVSDGHFYIFAGALFFFGMLIPSVFSVYGKTYGAHEGFAAGVACLASLAGYVVNYYFPVEGKAASFIVPAVIALSGILLFIVSDSFRVPAPTPEDPSGDET